MHIKNKILITILAIGLMLSASPAVQAREIHGGGSWNSDFHNGKFIINFPSEGGDIIGELTNDIIDTSIVGTFTGGTSGTFEGTIVGELTQDVNNGESKNYIPITGTINGKLDEEGNIGGTLEYTTPYYTQKGNITGTYPPKAFTIEEELEEQKKLEEQIKNLPPEEKQPETKIEVKDTSKKHSVDSQPPLVKEEEKPGEVKGEQDEKDEDKTISTLSVIEPESQQNKKAKYFALGFALLVVILIIVIVILAFRKRKN